MRENADQNQSEYGHLLRGVSFQHFNYAIKFCRTPSKAYQQVSTIDLSTGVYAPSLSSLSPTWILQNKNLNAIF